MVLESSWSFSHVHRSWTTPVAKLSDFARRRLSEAMICCAATGIFCGSATRKHGC